MKVIVDKRTEFIGIVLMLSKYNQIYEFFKNPYSNEEYINGIMQWFDKYKNDEFIKLTNEIIDKYENFNYSTPLDLVLRYFDTNFNRIESADKPEYVEILNGRLIQKFLYKLPSFANITKFEEFYKNHSDFYNKCINFQQKYLQELPLSIEQYFLNFYGTDKSPNMRCNLLLTNSCRGGFGMGINGILYPSLTVDFKGEKQFPCSFTFLFHEMSHPVINPLTDKYLKGNVETKLEIQHYGKIKSIINDSIIRAAEIILCNHMQCSTEFIKRKINMEKAQGFEHIEKVVACLENYSSHRKRYPNIESFFPTLLDTVVDQIKSYSKEVKQVK